ncbi:MAG: MFS transporter [Pseudolysinimonas sp.]
MTATEQVAAPDETPGVFSEPTKLVTGGWIGAFAAAWLGIWMAQLAPFQQVLPVQVSVIGKIPASHWQDAVVAFGIISGIAGVCALIAFPLTGALSDRTTSRFGRRRPWILAGTIIFAGALVALGLQTTLVGLGVCWSLAIIGFCVLTSSLTATISDQVPVRQRGVASSWISAPQAIGTILGIVLVTIVITDQVFGYLALALLLLVLVLPFLLRAPDARLTVAQRPPFTLKAIVQGMWISPRTHPDFGWTLLSRILVNVGNALGTGLLFYFLEFGLGMSLEDANTSLLVLVAVYLVGVVISSLVGGRLSDRLGRRKPFVMVSAVLQGIAALILALFPILPAAIVGALILGLGYGCFLAVDQALATQVLPDPADRGKDLGIMNIATAVPQAVAPLVGALVVATLGGFPGLFVLSAVAAVLGALAILPIKKVR